MKVNMRRDDKISPGLRAEKKKATYNRIATIGMNLFREKGFDHTTLDEIAAKAGVSRRNLFYYFKSKDDILFAQMGRYAEGIRAAVLEVGRAHSPMQTSCDALLKLVERFPKTESLVLGEVMKNVRLASARRYASYVQFEQALFESLCELWPGEEDRFGLRIVAMIVIGAVRLSVDRWIDENYSGLLLTKVQEAFAHLTAQRLSASAS